MIIINMNQIYRIIPTVRPNIFFIKMLIITLTLFDPALSYLFPSDFSAAYAEMIKSTKNHHEWWRTCKSIANQTLQDVCFQYITQPVHPNRTQPEEDFIAHQIDSQSAPDQEQFNLLQVSMIISEECYKVILETWEEIFNDFMNEQEDSRPVQYDDNYASLNGGAIILRKSSNKIHNAQAILEDSSEKYLYSDQKLPIEIVIALKQEVKIERISLQSNEIYSSIVKDFILQGALNQDQASQQNEDKIWFKLLSAEAKNSGTEQHFRIKKKVVRFLRLRIVSTFGEWKYFTMTQFKVYGSGLFAEALIDYQTVQNSSQTQSSQNELQLAGDLNLIYQQLNSFGKEQQKRPDQNVLTFLLEKVNTLSKIHQFQIFYMHNLSQRLQNTTNMQKEFRQHKNQYLAKSNFEQKYKQNRKFEQKIVQLQQTLKHEISKYNHLIQQFKYTGLNNTEVCPNKQEQHQKVIIKLVIATIIVNLIITFFVGYCCLKFFRRQENVRQIHQNNSDYL